MYRLTPRMEQHFRQSLATYHHLFDGNRCKGWELEELVFKAIKSDKTTNHSPKWQGAGHDDKADILVNVNGTSHQIKIKSGEIRMKRNKTTILSLSGYRLGRFEDDLSAISAYLNNKNVNILSVPYRKIDGDEGRKHIYRLCYIPADFLKGITGWEPYRKQWRTTNNDGVLFKLTPSMSWQIWWEIPLSIINPDKELTDGRFI